MNQAVSRSEYTGALAARVQRDILDACTACGRCADVCPMIDAAEISRIDSPRLVLGVLQILAGGEVVTDSRRWIEACSSSASCVPACSYGVNPLFMMEMARVALKRRSAQDVAANATRAFQGMAKSVRYLSRLLLTPETLERLDPKASRQARERDPELVLYTGCNVLRTPHIALICLDVLERLGVAYEVMGGPSHCCGAYQMREGDTAAATGMAMNTIGKMAGSGAPEIVSWCPSCQLQFGSIHLPTYAAVQGAPAPFDYTPFFLYLERRLPDLLPHLVNPVPRRIALDERPFDPAVVRAVKRILLAIPGVEIVELDVQHVGMMSNTVPLPAFKKKLRDETFAKAEAAAVTTFATIYHACHREIVSYAPQVDFEVVNVMEIIADCIGIAHEDGYKDLQSVRNVDAFIDARAELVEVHKLSLDEARTVALGELAANQPL